MGLRNVLYRKKESLKRKTFRLVNGYCNVLLYHRVSDETYDPQQLCVSPDNFHDQLKGLKRKGIFITIDEFTDHLVRKKRFPRSCHLITFDDGYADNLHNAIPVLETLGLQAVFYVSTANINTGNLFWWDQLDLAFKNPDSNIEIFRKLMSGFGFSTPQELYSYYIRHCKLSSSVQERDELMNQLPAITAGSAILDRYRCLTNNELKTLADSKSAVMGAHTINHLSLAELDYNGQKLEISGSIRFLENLLNKKIEHFSFPYGEKSHFNDNTVAVCRELGLKSAAANYYQYATNKDDIHAFPRLVIRNDSFPELKRKLQQLTA
jgi:peptidoglycan/xylan/chitin deacetylase (PgdA/CDA1 family)